MTESQFYVALLAIISAAGSAIALAIRWGVGRVVKALDENSISMLGNTASNAKLGEKIDAVSRYVQWREPTPPPMPVVR